MNVLVVCAHPDDETLGCGGTLLKHRAAGDRLFWLIATTPDETLCSPETIRQKAKEVTSVAQAYEVEDFHNLGFASAKLDMVPMGEVIESIRGFATKVSPEVVYTVHHGDVHTDHRVLFVATASVFKSFYMRDQGVRRMVSCEILSSTEAAAPTEANAFVPTLFSDITLHIERKLEIMKLYESESHPYPLPRNPDTIRALARYRGASVGLEYAEAFALVREIM